MYKYRLELSKGEPLRYISHLDFAELVRRAVLRAKLPAAYSEGFNPHLKFTFLAALALGVTSDGEYMDIELNDEVAPDEIKDRLTAQFPAGAAVKAVKKINPLSVWRKAQPNLAEYRVIAPLTDGANAASIGAAIEKFNAATEIPYTRKTPKKMQHFELKQYLAAPLSFALDEENKALILPLAIKITPSGSIKPNEILNLLQSAYALPIDAASALINREKLLYKNKNMLYWI